MAGSDFPTRSYMDDVNITWRHGKPDYSLVNEKYIKEKSQNHKADSLEKIVENLVKTWEMESTHKCDLKDWQSIAKDGSYFLQVNGDKTFTAEDNVALGNYNMLLVDCPFIDVSKETHDSSHAVFKEAFSGGFPWEVLEVLSGPPKVVFTWRHWTKWTGPYKGRAPTGETIELFSICVSEVTADLKLKYIKVFYDPNPMMMQLTGVKCPIMA